MDTRHSTTPRPFYEAVSPFARLAPIIEKGPPPTGFLRPGKKAWALTPGSAAATVEKGEPGRGVAVVPLDVGPAGLRLYILDEDDPGITERINGLWGDAPQLTAFTPTGGRHRYALTERRDLPAKNGVVKGKLDTRAYGKVSYVVGPGSITTEAAYDSEKRPSTEGPWRYRLEVDPRLVGEDGSIEIPALPVKVEDWLASKNGAKKAKAKAAETGRDYAAEPPDEWRKIVEATLRRHTDGTTDFHGAIQLAVGQAWNLGIEHRPTLIAAGRMAEDRYAGREKRPGEVERWADWFLEGNAERQPGEPTEYERRMAARDRAQAAQERAGAAGPSTGPESAPEPQERAGAEIEAAAGASTRRSKAEWLAEQGYTNLPDAAEHYARLVAIHERSEDWSDAAEALATAAAGYAEQLKARGHAPPPVAGFEFDRNRPEVSFRRRLAAVGISVRHNAFSGATEINEKAAPSDPWDGWTAFEKKAASGVIDRLNRETYPYPDLRVQKRGDGEQTRMVPPPYSHPQARHTADHMFDAAAMNRVENPVLLWLEDLPETEANLDAVSKTILEGCLEVHPDDLERAAKVLSALGVALCRRQIEPGAKFDSVMVFVGRQGLGKGSFWKLLLPKKTLHTDSLRLDDDVKVVAEKLEKTLIAEVAELAGIKRAEIEKVDALLSSDSDDGRKAYGYNSAQGARTACIVGTTNADEGLAVQSGEVGRRYQPVRVAVHPGAAANKVSEYAWIKRTMERWRATWWRAAFDRARAMNDGDEITLPYELRRESAEAVERHRFNPVESVEVEVHHFLARRCVRSELVGEPPNHETRSVAAPDRVRGVSTRDLVRALTGQYANQREKAAVAKQVSAPMKALGYSPTKTLMTDDGHKVRGYETRRPMDVIRALVPGVAESE